MATLSTKQTVLDLKQRLPEGAVVRAFTYADDQFSVRLGFNTFWVALRDDDILVTPNPVYSDLNVSSTTVDSLDSLVALIKNEPAPEVPEWVEEFLDTVMPRVDSDLGEVSYSVDEARVVLQTAVGRLELSEETSGFEVKYKIGVPAYKKAQITVQDMALALKEVRGILGALTPDWTARDTAETFLEAPESLIVSLLVRDPATGFRCEVASRHQTRVQVIRGLPRVLGDTPSDSYQEVLRLIDSQRRDQEHTIKS